MQSIHINSLNNDGENILEFLLRLIEQTNDRNIRYRLEGYIKDVIDYDSSPDGIINIFKKTPSNRALYHEIHIEELFEKDLTHLQSRISDIILEKNKD